MKRNIAAIVPLSLVLSGCVTLGKTEEMASRELQSYGISPTEIEVKSPAVAGALNLLPGFGNFYLAVGTNEGVQWAYGFGNLLFWPLSVVWGIPEALTDAKTINQRETVYYYTLDPAGQQKLARLRAERQGSTAIAPSAPVVPMAPAPTAPQVVSSAEPAIADASTPPPPTSSIVKAAPAPLTAGSRAVVAAGGAIRARPTFDGQTVEILAPGASVQLVTRIQNGSGAWWFVNADSFKGWISESELAIVTGSAS